HGASAHVLRRWRRASTGCRFVAPAPEVVGPQTGSRTGGVGSPCARKGPGSHDAHAGEDQRDASWEPEGTSCGSGGRVPFRAPHDAKGRGRPTFRAAGGGKNQMRIRKASLLFLPTTR